MLYNLKATMYFKNASLFDAVINNAMTKLRATILELNQGISTPIEDFYSGEVLEDNTLKLDLKVLFISEVYAEQFAEWLVSLGPWTVQKQSIVRVQKYDNGQLGDIIFDQSFMGSDTTEIPTEADEWRQPSHADNAYNEQDVVLHKGKLWESLIPGNVWLPSVSGWRQVVNEGGGEIADWIQPTGAHDAYPLGSEVMYNGKKWQSTVDNNVWEPGVFGWQEM